MVANGEMPFRRVYKKHGTDENRQLEQTNDACKQACDNKRASQNVSEDNIVGQGCTGEPVGDARSCVLKFVHVRDKLQSLVSDEDPQSNPEKVQKTGPVAVAPRFH